MISKEQIKAARAMLDWSQKVLANKCDAVSEPTIKLIESGRVNSTPETLGALKKTLESAGIEFLPQKGVRFRQDLLTVIEPQDEDDNVYLRLMDDIYNTVHTRPSEVLFSFIDQSLSPSDVIDRQLMIRKTGSPMRCLIRHGDDHLIYPLEEYRFLPKGNYLNNPTVVYRNKFAVVINDPIEGGIEKIIIINDPDVSEIKRMEFNIIWNYGKQPVSTNAEKVYD